MTLKQLAQEAVEERMAGEEASLPPYIYGREAGPNEKVWTQAAVTALRAERDAARQERDGLRAARIAYANEFPLNADGEPDVGSIHANIRALKAAPVVDVEAVIDAGGAMANAMFNLAQWEEERLTRSLCERFKSMQVKWDAARSALRSAIEGKTL